jgi:TatD DNase family protein
MKRFKHYAISLWDSMIIADVHCHLDYFREERIKEVIADSEKAGVKAIITNGTTPESNSACVELAKKYSVVKPALGLHPEFIDKFDDKTIEEQVHFVREHRKEIVAIGEIGLDYHWVKDEHLIKRQKALFENMIGIAKELSLPAIVHTRDAESDAVEMILSSGIKKVIMHCFSGNKSLINLCFEKRLMFSIPTSIVRSRHFQMMAEMLPLSQLLTETDAPFLSPFPGKENEPAFIAETIKKIAGIKKMDETEVANILYANYQKAFM